MVLTRHKQLNYYTLLLYIDGHLKTLLHIIIIIIIYFLGPYFSLIDTHTLLSTCTYICLLFNVTYTKINNNIYKLLFFIIFDSFI